MQISINDELLIRSIAAMPNNLSIDKFQQLCEIKSRTTTEELLKYLLKLGIGKFVK